MNAKILLVCMGLVFTMFVTNCFAEQPILVFSDLDSGPNAGNPDTSGGRVANEHGAIVTVWGKKLGSIQGTSKIYLGGKESPYVYYWGDATSPANLYVSHGMQKVSFQVHKTSDSSGIYIVTPNGKSNVLPFVVRNGNIYFVDGNNTSSGTGTYADPWKSPASYVSKLTAGEKGVICYFRAGSYANTEYGIQSSTNKSLFYLNQKHSGIDGAPNAFIGYPNEIASLEATAGITKFDDNYFMTIFQDWGTGFWDDGSHKNVLHYLTISNLKFVTNTFVTSVRNHWRFIGNHCESDPDGTIFNQGTGMLNYSMAKPESSEAFLQEAKIYGNVITGDTSKNKLNHAIYLGLGNSPDVGWNYIYDHDIGTGPYISFNSEQSVQKGYGRLINARIHDNVIDMENKPSTAIQSHQLPPGSTIFIYNNIIKGPTLKWFTMNFSSGGIHLYNNTIYSDISNIGAGAVLSFVDLPNYHPDIIDVRNNIIYAISSTGPKNYLNIKDTLAIPTPIIGNNLYYGNIGGTFTGKASAGTNSLIDVEPKFINAAVGDFHLQESSPIKDAGVSIVPSIVVKDFDGISLPQGTGYPIGAYDYSNPTITIVDTSPPLPPQMLMVQ